MLYLNEKDVRRVGVDWNLTVGAIEDAVRALAQEDYAQPVKPYLRYRDRTNRIIAMPAFLGGAVDRAGIKWIASFPRNIDRGTPRAHSVTILNDAATGAPLAVLNGALFSVIRTASVSGLMTRSWLARRPASPLKVGVTGWGPIARDHVAMMRGLFGDRVREFRVFDVRPVDPDSIREAGPDVRSVGSWREAYEDADVFITCTASDHAYVDLPPKPGSLQLNVSLRDYKPCFLDWVRESIVVDDWQEVCRERTDVEMMHLERGLRKEDTHDLVDVVCRDFLARLPLDVPVMFNPMGMAIFDVATAAHFVARAEALGVGTTLN
jgi:ornithine cyclodeaminase